jgi:electron transfer flavoprotein beta subunit
LKLREKSPGSLVNVVTVGPKARAVEALRTALAMGADNAIVVDAPDFIDSNTAAKGLAETIKKEGAFKTVFCGKQAIDDDCAQVPQLLAEYLNAPHSTVVVKFEAGADGAVVQREIEGGTREVIELKFPAVIGADKGLNTPRYASLPGIMKAKKKEIKEYSLAALGISDADAKIAYKAFQLPPARQAVKFLEGASGEQAQQLVKLLREEAKAI